jgi:hypothetical protein
MHHGATADNPAAEKILVAMDKETEELLMVQSMDSLEDLELRMSLISS